MLTGLSTLTTPPTLCHARRAEVGDAVPRGRSRPRPGSTRPRSPRADAEVRRCRTSGPVRVGAERRPSTVCSAPSRSTTTVDHVARRVARGSASPSSLGASDGVAPSIDDDDVAGLQPGRRPRDRRSRSRPTPTRPLATRSPFDRVDAEQQRDRDEHVHDRPGGDHQQPARVALAAVRARPRRSACDLVEVVHPDDPHERAERQRAHAVLGLAAAEAPQLGPMNRKNWVTFIPVSRAVTKWPSSCRKIETSSPTTNTNAHVLQHAEQRRAARRCRASDEPRLRRRRRSRSPSGLVAGAAGQHLVAELVELADGVGRPAAAVAQLVGVDLGHRRIVGDEPRGDPSGGAIGGDDVVDRVVGTPIVPLQGGVAHLGDLRPAEPAGEERLDRDLVGRAEPRRRGAAGAAGVRRRARGSGTWSRSGASKSSAAERAPSRCARTACRCGAGYAERVADRQAHVGHAELGDRRAVGELDHRVDDRLRVHDDLDLVVRRRRTARGPRSPRGPCSSACCESMVIFGPIDHVGWASASSTVTSASSSAVRPRNGPPLAVSTSRATSRSASTDERRHWWTAQCSLSTGTSSAPGVGRSGCTTGPAAIRLSLLASARRLPARSVRDRDRQAGEADDGVDHDVGVVDQVGEVGDHLGERQRGGHLGPPRRIGDGDDLRAELAGLRDQRRRPTSRRRGRRPRSGRASARTTSSVCVPIEPRRAGDGDTDRRHRSIVSAEPPRHRRRAGRYLVTQGSSTSIR